jgi:hypothetical protein
MDIQADDMQVVAAGRSPQRPSVGCGSVSQY